MKAITQVLITCILFMSLGLLVGIAKAEAPTQEKRKVLTLRQQIDTHIALEASKWHVDAHKMSLVIECESGFNTTIVGDGGRALGLAQFHKPTFYAYSQDGEEYTNWRDQITVMARMWSLKQQSHWTCYKMV